MLAELSEILNENLRGNDNRISGKNRGEFDIMKKLSLRELEYLSGLLEMVANANRLVSMYEEEIERLEGIINQQKI